MQQSEFAGSSAVSADDLRALVREITESVARGVDASMAHQFAEFGERIGSLEGSVEALRADYGSQLKTLAEAVARAEKRLSDIDTVMASAERRLSNIDSMMARTDKRLSAMETFPSLPINQPSRLYATQVQSVSHPKRVRVGYAG